MNNKDALDNIRRKAPAPRKVNGMGDDIIPAQQMDLVNTQMMAIQQQLQQLQERYNELSMHHSMLLQELIGVQKTVVNHEHVMQYVMNFLNSVDAQRRRESRIQNPNPFGNGATNGNIQDNLPPIEEDAPASPLQHASKLLNEVNADHILNTRNLEQISEQQMRLHANMGTPPPTFANQNGQRATKTSQPVSATTTEQSPIYDIDNMVYPIGQSQGIDPMYSEHIHNIPYPMPQKGADGTFQAPPVQAIRKKSTQFDPGWVRQPQILLVEDDQTCRRIGGKFLVAFQCTIDSAVSSGHMGISHGRCLLTLH